MYEVISNPVGFRISKTLGEIRNYIFHFKRKQLKMN